MKIITLLIASLCAQTALFCMDNDAEKALNDELTTLTTGAKREAQYCKKRTDQLGANIVKFKTSAKTIEQKKTHRLKENCCTIL